MVIMKCTICEHQAEPCCTINGYEIFECREWDHLMTLPQNYNNHTRNIFSDNYFFNGGAGYPNYLDMEEFLVKHGHQYANILSKYIKNRGTVLDVGSSAGFILKGLVDYGWQGYGIEVNDRMASFGRDKMGLNIQTATFETFETEQSFDLICFLQVIAHFLDPSAAIQKAFDILSPEGHILIETWDCKSWTAKLFGKKWHEFSPPSVVHWFSKKSLNLLMQEHDFHFVASGRTVKRISMKHARSLILYKIGDGMISRSLKFLFRLFPENLIIRYPAEDLFWVLYRK